MDAPISILVLAGLATYVWLVFRYVRRFAASADALARKAILYGTVIGGVAGIVVLGKALPDQYLGLLFVFFLTIMASFFAVIFAD